MITIKRGWDEEGENGINAVGLGFEGVGVEGRSVVAGIDVVQPVEIMEHRAGTKSRCAPFLQIAVDDRGLPGEFTAAAIQAAVVAQIMNTDFEAVLFQIVDEIARDGVIAFGYEI